MLGPPRLSKLLFEAALLARVHPPLAEAAALDPEDTASRAEALVARDDELRQRIPSIGLPVLLPDGRGISCAGPRSRFRRSLAVLCRESWTAVGWICEP